MTAPGDVVTVVVPGGASFYAHLDALRGPCALVSDLGEKRPWSVWIRTSQIEELWVHGQEEEPG